MNKSYGPPSVHPSIHPSIRPYLYLSIRPFQTFFKMFKQVFVKPTFKVLFFQGKMTVIPSVSFSRAQTVRVSSLSPLTPQNTLALWWRVLHKQTLLTFSSTGRLCAHSSHGEADAARPENRRYRPQLSASSCSETGVWQAKGLSADSARLSTLSRLTYWAQHL